MKWYLVDHISQLFPIGEEAQELKIISEAGERFERGV